MDLPEKPLNISDEKLAECQKRVDKFLAESRKEDAKHHKKQVKSFVKRGYSRQEAEKEIEFIENY